MASFFVLAIAQPILMGFVAQKYFRQIGVLWWGIALALMLLVVFVVTSGQESNPRWFFDAEYRAFVNSDFQRFVMSAGAAIVSSVIVLIVLATLPKKAPQ